VERIVIDASVVLSWLFRESGDETTQAVASSIRQLQFIVPSTRPIEVANALLVAERRKRFTSTDTDAIKIYLAGLPVHVDGKTNDFVFSDTLDLAREYRLTVYDAAYLELALRECVPLATLDAEMKAAAEAAGVRLFRPRTP
jgi:predicted nucleic acid-binding protein